MRLFDPSSYQFSPYAVPTAITAILLVVVGGAVALLRRSRVTRAFLVMSVAGTLWLTAFTLLYLSADEGTALFWARASYLGVPFLAPAVYLFVVEMLGIHDRRRAAVAGTWTLAAVASILSVTTAVVIPEVSRWPWGFYPRFAAAPGLLFMAFFSGCMIGAVVELMAALRSARGVEKKRIVMILIGFAVAYVAFVDFLPNFGVRIYPFGYFPILIFVFCIAYTVRRYDLTAITPSFAAKEIIETMADPLFVCDPDDCIRFVNDASVALSGYDVEELVGRKLSTLIEAKDGADGVLRSHRGEEIDVTLSTAPLVRGSDHLGTVTIARDVRERKRSERALSQAMNVLRSTLDSTTDGILVVGEGGSVVSYNQRFLDLWRMTGDVIARASDQTMFGWMLDRVVDPEALMRVVDSLASQPEAESFDLVDLRDGRRFERRSTGRKVDGGAEIRVWSFRDVTDRFAAEKALRESEIRYRLLFEENAAGVCVMSSAGVIVDCNNTFAQMLDWDRARLIGENMRSLYERPVELDELIDMLRDAQNLNSVEVELKRSDGSRRWVLQNLILIGEGEGAVVHATLVDISDRKRAEEQIEFHAYHDILTNLPNRKLFADRLRQNLTHARRSGRPLAVMFIDIDHFKTINDTLGHTCGDELLLEMSYRLRHCVREDDTVARLGGDEFTIILSELRHPEDAANVAQKILRSVQVPLSLGGMAIEVTASIGIAIYPVDGNDAEALLRNADSAMYKAKESGRNNYQLCTDEMKLRAMDRLSLEARLRKAITGHQLVLHYQPQVNLLTGRIVGVEALVRWNDPERGLVDPGEFIPIAEESRLILPIGEWVLRTACRDMRLWQTRGIAPSRVAVNLSPRQFQQHNLAQTVQSALRDTGLASSALEIEITESTAMQNAEVTIDVLRELRATGVAIAIDDFGTGYSSLNYLKRFPINAIKIDRAFVSDIPDDENDVAIVSAVIGIARSLRIRVLAEGVETSEQFAFLRRKECDEAQGFYFSRPVNAEEMARILTGSTIVTRQTRLTI